MTDRSGETSTSSALDSDLALAHWGEHCDGGGDRVAWELARTFTDAPLYVGWRDATAEPADVRSRQLFDGWLMNAALKRGGLPRMGAHLLGWQVARPLREYDVLVTSGNEPLFYVAPDDQTWIAYVHHTNRRQSDLIDEVDKGLVGNAKLLLYYLIRVAYDHNTHRPDRFVANSEIVKRRMVRYWGVPEEKISVVYPPVDTHKYDPDDAVTGDYYLTLSRLDWHKNIDEIVKTFNDFDGKRLVIAGDGPEREELEAIAGPNIEFKGYVDEGEKRQLLAGAKAFVFNGRDEDFGIAPVEALAAGTPLLGIREGMTQYQVIDGKTGYSHVRSGENGPSLRETIQRFEEEEGVVWNDDEIASFANKFSVDAFQRRMREVVEEAVAKTEIVPDWVDQHGDR